MVKRLAWVLLLMSQAASAVSLTAQLDKPVTTMGEPVKLTVQAKGLSLDALDVAPLAARFEVFARTLSRGEAHETLELTLYPRATGTLFIPPLALETLRTRALSLRVDEGSEALPRVFASWTLAPASPFVNQPARLSLSVCDDGSLQWQRPALPVQSARLVRVLGEDESEAERDGETCTVHRYDWALIATQGGAGALAVPMIDATRFGQRYRFPGPSVNYTATALPAWLPAHVPPVAPTLQADPLPARWPVRRPLAWQIQVTGGYSAEGLKALLDLQLQDSPTLGVYPPLIEAVVMDDAASPLSRFVVTVYLQPRENGDLRLPTLRFPWYDVVRGQMSSTPITGPRVAVFDPRWQWARRVGAGGGIVLAFLGLVWQGRRMARWRIARTRGLQAIRESESVEALAQAVRQFSLKDDQLAAPSLGEWVRQLRQESVTCEVEAAVSQLEQLQFGQTAMPLGELKQNFLSVLAHVRPKRLFRALH